MSQSSIQSRKRPCSSEKSDIPKTSKSYSTYDDDFEQKLIDRGIYPDGYEMWDDRIPLLSTNLEDIRQRLIEPRRSLSPTQFSESDFSNFKRKNVQARYEPKAMAKVVLIIAGGSDDLYLSETGVPFGHLEPLDKDLARPVPDIYYGAKPEQIDRESVMSLENISFRLAIQVYQ